MLSATFPFPNLARNPPRRLLLVKLSSLGDLAHALPLADALRVGFPDAHIAWAVKDKFVDILVGNPNLDAVHILPTRSGGHKARAIWQLGKILRNERFDIALDAQGLFISGLITRLSGAPIRVGFDLNREQNARFLTHATVPATERQHITDTLMGFCDALSILRTPIGAQTYLACAEAETAEALFAAFPRQTPIVGCIIGASRADKAWPRERWIELMNALSTGGFVPMLLGGKAEESLAQDIEQNAPVARNLVGQTPLRVLTAVLARCAVVVGGDSGPLHLAAAVGTPVVGLYGVTDPQRTGPNWGVAPTVTLDFAETDAPPATRRARHTTLTDALLRIPASVVLDAVEKLAKDRNLGRNGGVNRV